nr:immunoglobulin heavy chain junction region [Mus musculus]
CARAPIYDGDYFDYW